MEYIKKFNSPQGEQLGLNLTSIGATIDGTDIKEYISQHGGGSTHTVFHVETIDDLANISNPKAGDIAYIDSLGKTYFEYDNQWVIKQLDVPTNEEQYGWRDTWGYNETISPIIEKLCEYIYNATITLKSDVKLILRDLDEWFTGKRVTGYGVFSRCTESSDIFEFRATIWMCEMRCFDYMIAKYDENTTVSYIWNREVQVPEVPIKKSSTNNPWQGWDFQKDDSVNFVSSLYNDTYNLSNGIFYQILLPKNEHANETFAVITDGDGNELPINRTDDKRIMTQEANFPGINGNITNYVASSNPYYNIISNEVVDNDIFRITWTAGNYDMGWEHPENQFAPFCIGVPNKNYVYDEVIIEDVEVLKYYIWINTEKYPNFSLVKKDDADWANIRVFDGWMGNDEFKLLSGSYYVKCTKNDEYKIKGELRK